MSAVVRGPLCTAPTHRLDHKAGYSVCDPKGTEGSERSLVEQTHLCCIDVPGLDFTSRLSLHVLVCGDTNTHRKLLPAYTQCFYSLFLFVKWWSVFNRQRFRLKKKTINPHSHTNQYWWWLFSLDQSQWSETEWHVPNDIINKRVHTNTGGEFHLHSITWTPDFSLKGTVSLLAPCSCWVTG